MLGLLPSRIATHSTDSTLAGNPEGFTSEHLITLMQWHKLPYDERTFRASMFNGQALLRNVVGPQTSAAIGMSDTVFVALHTVFHDMKYAYDNQGPCMHSYHIIILMLMFAVCTDATPYLPDPVPLAPAAPPQPVQRAIVQPGMSGCTVLLLGADECR